MAVRESIFGSRMEKRGFRSIEQTWGNDYKVWPQIPFSLLFSPDETIRDASNFFFKTSVDYVLCSNDGGPLLAIDFDGMGRGFNSRGQYVQFEPTSDRNRKWKFDFKIRYAAKYQFPYYIVSSEEFEHVGRDSALTIVDGLIGTELAKRDVRERLPMVVENHRHMIDEIPLHEQYEYLQDLIIGVEVDSDFTHNRIVQQTAELRLSLAGSVGWSNFGWRWRPLKEPAGPPFDGTGYNLATGVATTSWVERVGSECTLVDTPLGNISATAWMRDIGDYSPGCTITRELAELLAWSKLARLLKSSAAAPN